MRAGSLVAVAGVAALATAALQACGVFCADCHCGPMEELVVDEADDTDLVGAVLHVQADQLTIEYDKGGLHWTVTYDLVEGPTETGDTGG